MKVKTCNWCWDVYFMENADKHKSCMRKKYTFLNNRKKSIAFDKSKTYYENYSPKNWKHSSESMKLIPAVHAMKFAKLENFDSRALSRFERYLVIELF